MADDLGNDIFLGGIKFVPNFDGMGNQDQWYDLSGGSGKIQIGVSYQPHYGQSLTIDDFELMTVIGKGSFGKVTRLSCLILQNIKNFTGAASQEKRYFSYIRLEDDQKGSYRQPK